MLYIHYTLVIITDVAFMCFPCIGCIYSMRSTSTASLAGSRPDRSVLSTTASGSSRSKSFSFSLSILTRSDVHSQRGSGWGVALHWILLQSPLPHTHSSCTPALGIITSCLGGHQFSKITCTE